MQKPGPEMRKPHETTGTDAVQDGDLVVTVRDSTHLSSRLASELFARLLLELPEHRCELQSAGRDGDSGRLAQAAHKLLGAVVYCDLPELAGALRELKGMAESGHTAQTGAALNMVLRRIDQLLASSGYGGA